jgi:hypothetical protein
LTTMVLNICPLRFVFKNVSFQRSSSIGLT